MNGRTVSLFVEAMSSEATSSRLHRVRDRKLALRGNYIVVFEKHALDADVQETIAGCPINDILLHAHLRTFALKAS